MMGISLSQDMRMLQGYECNIDDIIYLLNSVSEKNPELSRSLENYFSPMKSEMLEAEFTNYLKQEVFLLNRMDSTADDYIALTLSFQFTAPLLGLLKVDDHKGIFGQYSRFRKVLKEKYQIDDPQMKFDIDGTASENYIEESNMLKAYSENLESNISRHELKESVKRKFHKDGVDSVHRWQHHRNSTGQSREAALAEAFGRSIIIPAFFLYNDKRLIDFYKDNSRNIKYYIELPELLR